MLNFEQIKSVCLPLIIIGLILIIAGIFLGFVLVKLGLLLLSIPLPLFLIIYFADREAIRNEKRKKDKETRRQSKAYINAVIDASSKQDLSEQINKLIAEIPYEHSITLSICGFSRDVPRSV